MLFELVKYIIDKRYGVAVAMDEVVEWFVINAKPMRTIRFFYGDDGVGDFRSSWSDEAGG